MIALSETGAHRESRCSSRHLAVLVALALILQACVSIPKRDPVPEEMVEQAAIPGIPLARFWGDELPADVDRRIDLLKEQMQADGSRDIFREPKAFLSISGGGADGAFGAGILKGWSESGQRPKFWIVTGISTGALIAPFAFLGSDYDDELEELYTSMSTSDLIKQRGIISGLTSDALADTTPLMNILKRVIDKTMIDRIADQYRRGRRLLIGTTNLDAQRPVIWNIGEIAAKGTPESRQLIRDVILASASIPVAFPPVRVQVSVGDEVYDELHVDGGTSSQVFLFPAALNIRTTAERIGITGKITGYVIRNGLLKPRWSAIEPKLRPIVLASVTTLIRTQGVGDLYRIYLGAKRDGVEFKLAYIPDYFDVEPEEEFDAKYMQALFDLGYELSRDGYEWANSPPGVALP
jgi:predicted acylesterase/phospholipase RssA